MMSNILGNPLGVIAVFLGVATAPSSIGAQRAEPAAFAPSGISLAASRAPSPVALLGHSTSRTEHAVKGAVIGFVVGVVAVTTVLATYCGGGIQCWQAASRPTPFLATAGGLGAVTGLVIGATWWEPPEQSAK